MKEKPSLELHNLVEVKEISGTHGFDRVINDYLSLGWVIVEKWVVDIGDPGAKNQRVTFLFGWLDKTRKAEHPEHTRPGEVRHEEGF